LDHASIDRHGCLGCSYVRKAKTQWRIFQKDFLHATTHSNQAASLPCRPSLALRRHQCGTCSRSPISALGHPIEKRSPFLSSSMSDVHETRPCLRPASMRRKGLPRTSCLADHCRAADLYLVLHRIMVCTRFVVCRDRAGQSEVVSQPLILFGHCGVLGVDVCLRNGTDLTAASQSLSPGARFHQLGFSPSLPYGLQHPGSA
jgi:hypothetical protein